MTHETSAPLATFAFEPLSTAVASSVARLQRSRDVVAVAVLPDVHLEGDVCVGVATATRRVLYPQAVGGDIGCGMIAVPFDAFDVALTPQSAARLLLGLEANVPIATAARRDDDDDDDDDERLLARLDAAPDLGDRRTLAKIIRRQRGTLGTGNHFVELQQDEHGRLWLLVHSGSRGVGPHVRDAALAHESSAGLPGLVGLDDDSDAGRAYLAGHDLALAFAAHNRRAIVHAAAAVVGDVLGVGAAFDEAFDCHHNHVVRANVWGGPAWVHRKGANAADDGAWGVIPGSMGSATFHVVGRGRAAALSSSSHGAGRALSRADARHAVTVRALRSDLRGVFFDVRRAADLVEEAPAAYKDIGRVMRAQRDLVRVVRTLRPLLAFKGASKT